MALEISYISYSQIGENDPRLRFARAKDIDTGEERVLEYYELPDPEDAEVGDEIAYDVQLNSKKIFSNDDLK